MCLNSVEIFFISDWGKSTDESVNYGSRWGQVGVLMVVKNTTTWTGGEPTQNFIFGHNWGFLSPYSRLETSAANKIISNFNDKFAHILSIVFYCYYSFSIAFFFYLFNCFLFFFAMTFPRRWIRVVDLLLTE